MRWFYDLKIATKLILGFVLVALIAAIVGVVGLVNLNQIVEADGQLYERNTLGLDYAGNATVFYQRIRFNLVKGLAINVESERNNAIKNVRDYTDRINELAGMYANREISDENRDLFGITQENWAIYSALADEATKLLENNQLDEAEYLIFGEIGVVGERLQNAFDALFEFNSKAGKERADENERLATVTSITMIIVIVIGVAIAVFLGLFISRIIANPVKEMDKVAMQLASGDVEVGVNIETDDEIGHLAQSFREMIANIRQQALIAERIADGDLTVEVEVRSDRDLLNMKLREIVEKNNEVLSNVVASSEQVAAGSKQVSESSMELSQGAAEQASSIEELTASIEEISTQTQENAANANRANDLSDQAKENADRGNQQMNEMLKAMEEINEASANISNIIKVIDEIAFQTNILALNAAVEAARAGQHGQGFAVVAEEVRNLAARSAEAAQETTELIEGSIKKTEGGTRIAQETAEALNSIVQEIEEVATLINGITIASNEQAAGIEQINQGVMQVSDVVQANSATSEESAAASEELSGQAALLKEMVGQFRLKAITNSRKQSEELSPEVLKMLKEMAQQQYVSEAAASKETVVKGKGIEKPKIALSDQEFGKY